MFSFEVSKTCKDTKARAGKMVTSHGEVKTPVFMPVGTQGTVKAMLPEELEDLGAEIILGNTYHLSLRPGHEIIKKLGGLHKFMHWEGPILTDSGGFQVFSLGKGQVATCHPERSEGSSVLNYGDSSVAEPALERSEGLPQNDSGPKLISSKVTEEGVHFCTPIDGGLKHFLTPELAVEIQEALGSDIMMVLDECLPHGENESRTRESMELSLRWAARSLAARTTDNALFGIVQGGMFPHLRAEYIERLLVIASPIGVKQSPASNCVRGIASASPRNDKIPSHHRTIAPSHDFNGFSIGGLSVGEPNELMYEITDHCTNFLPKDKPRYLMGVGTPEDLLECIERGIDMFDCVWPTRNARTATIITAHGDLNAKNAKYKENPDPPDVNCSCYTCQNYSMAYLRHMFMCNEIVGARLGTIHNLHFYFDLIKDIRSAIAEERFLEFKQKFMSLRAQAKQSGV